MVGRNLNKKIEVWSTGLSVSDGFGGNTVSDAIVGSTYAKIRTANSSTNLENLGILDPIRSIFVTVRNRSSISIDIKHHYIKYAGKSYSIKASAVDKNFDHQFSTFICTEIVSKSNG